jgi:hypothetical protein
MIYLLTAIGLPPGGSSTVHIYTLRVAPELWVLNKDFASCDLAGAKNLAVASRLENLWTTETGHENAVCASVCNVVSFTSLCDAKNNSLCFVIVLFFCKR